MNLSRRSFLNGTLGLVALFRLGGGAVNSAPRSTLTNEPLGQNKTYVYLAEVRLPQNVSVSDFWSERRRWMDIEKFEEIVTSLKSRGELLEASHKVDGLKGRITYSYSFRTTADRDAFVKLVNAESAVSKASLLEIGYRFDRKYVTVPS